MKTSPFGRGRLLGWAALTLSVVALAKSWQGDHLQPAASPAAPAAHASAGAGSGGGRGSGAGAGPGSNASTGPTINFSLGSTASGAAGLTDGAAASTLRTAGAPISLHGHVGSRGLPTIRVLPLQPPPSAERDVAQSPAAQTPEQSDDSGAGRDEPDDRVDDSPPQPCSPHIGFSVHRSVISQAIRFPVLHVYTCH